MSSWQGVQKRSRSAEIPRSFASPHPRPLPIGRKTPNARASPATSVTGSAARVRVSAVHPMHGTGPSRTGTRTSAALMEVETQPPKVTVEVSARAAAATTKLGATAVAERRGTRRG
jgi:hypothetical protein